MSLRLNDLNNFSEISSCSTLREGAARLGITQPALSESIKRLEQDVGCVLFYRSKSGVSLTPSGRKILEYGKRALGLIAELESMTATPILASTVVIGCHPVVGSYTLPKALAQLSKGFRIELRHGPSRTIQSEIQKGSIDIGIVINPISNPDLVIRKLALDRVGVWHAVGTTGQQQIFCDPDLIQTQAILRKWKARSQSILSTSSLELAARLTAAGLGYGILPKRVVDLVAPGLKAVPSTPEYTDEIALVYRPEFGRLPFERNIIDALRSVY